jgi:hypothetical protein
MQANLFERHTTIRPSRLSPTEIGGSLLALVFVVCAASGCEVRSRSDRADPTPAAPAPLPVAAPVPTPVVAPNPTPVAPKPIVVVRTAPPPVDKTRACRDKIVAECTPPCFTKMDKQHPGKPQLYQDLCFAECTRAAVKRCP